jgi:hypothetical protein
MQLNYFDTIMSCHFAFQLFNIPTFKHSNVPTLHYPLSRTPRISCPMPPFVHASPKVPHLPIKKWFVLFRFPGANCATQYRDRIAGAMQGQTIARKVEHVPCRSIEGALCPKHQGAFFATKHRERTLRAMKSALYER